jgi:hypothetical protein
MLPSTSIVKKENACYYETPVTVKQITVIPFTLVILGSKKDEVATVLN